MGAFMFALGIGLGLVMQILVTAVQNSVEFKDLGAATAGANFFRSMGGSFGTAVFGALYVNVLPGKLVTQYARIGIHLDPRHVPTTFTYDMLRHLPIAQVYAIVHAIAGAIKEVYFWAIPFSVLAVILSLTLPEVKLRTAHPQGEALAPIPDTIG